MDHPTVLGSVGFAPRSCRFPEETRANPNKPKSVKACGISKISGGAEKQTHLGYLASYQHDGDKNRPFFEENGCDIPRFRGPMFGSAGLLAAGEPWSEACSRVGSPGAGFRRAREPARAPEAVGSQSKALRAAAPNRLTPVLASFAIVESLSKRSHSRESGNPLLNPWKHGAENWIPAFAGMTASWVCPNDASTTCPPG